jgi:Xaa-Pro dipeptidase
MTRRRAAVEHLFEEHHLDALVLYGADRSGSAVQWLTGWPVTREAAVLVQPGRPDRVLVQFHNHVPNAELMAGAAEVRWGGADTMRTLCGELDHHKAARIGIMGPIRHEHHRLLADRSSAVIPLDPAYVRLRMIKSPEEIEWMRRGAELSDRAVLALRDGLCPGIDEHELGALVESSYLGLGGTSLIHYFAVTSMADPKVCVPRQWPTTRKVESGDVLVTEISASWWGYPGQVLRTMILADEPTPLYAELHEVAETAYQKVLKLLRPGTSAEEVVAEGSVIEDAGFTTYDDLVHGLGGGYLPPVIASRSRSDAPVPDVVFAAGMTVVIQPNVVTPDFRAGVQTGGLVVVTEEGATPLQGAEGGLWRLG